MAWWELGCSLHNTQHSTHTVFEAVFCSVTNDNTDFYYAALPREFSAVVACLSFVLFHVMVLFNFSTSVCDSDLFICLCFPNRGHQSTECCGGGGGSCWACRSVRVWSFRSPVGIQPKWRGTSTIDITHCIVHSNLSRHWLNDFLKLIGEWFPVWVCDGMYAWPPVHKVSFTQRKFMFIHAECRVVFFWYLESYGCMCIYYIHP